MGVGKLNIWLSERGNACGTYPGSGRMTIFDCDGIVNWPCGRFRPEGADWQPVPGGIYRNLPYRCGHLEVELPPGCYWVVAGNSSVGSGYIHLNYASHVGIAQVECDRTACVKLFNPTIHLCWNWFLVGAMALADQGHLDRAVVDRVAETVQGELLQDVPRAPADDILAEVYDDFLETAAQGRPGGNGGKKKYKRKKK